MQHMKEIMQLNIFLRMYLKIYCAVKPSDDFRIQGSHKGAVKNIIFEVITPCSPMKLYRRLGATYGLHLQGSRERQARNQHEAGSKLTCHQFTLTGLYGVIVSQRIQLSPLQEIADFSTLRGMLIESVAVCNDAGSFALLTVICLKYYYSRNHCRSQDGH
jgi:hypothetical protein